ncbi:MAG: hypothetical protein AAF184_20080 [Pseudomonadota bacterium]
MQKYSSTGARLVCAALGITVGPIVLAQGLMIDDQLIECGVLDPEFDGTTNMLTYQRVNDTQPRNEVIVQWVDRVNDGDLIPSPLDIDSDPGFYTNTQAGPKFANGTRLDQTPELYLSYTRFDTSVGIRGYDPTRCTYPTSHPALCFDDTLDSRIPLAGASDGVRSIVYTSEDEGLPYRAQSVYLYLNQQGVRELRWSNLEEWTGTTTPGSERSRFRPHISWARLHELREPAGGGSLKAVATAPVPFAGTTYDQVILIDTANPAPNGTPDVQVTESGNTEEKFNPYLFYAPEFDANFVAYRSQVGANATSSSIVVYRETALGSGNWERFLTIDADEVVDPNGVDEVTGGRPFLLSPETFTRDLGNGQFATFLIYSSSDALMFMGASDGNVWATRLREEDPTGPPLGTLMLNSRERGVDMDAERIRAELEVYFPDADNANMPAFFYSEVVKENDGCGVPSGSILRDFSLRRSTVSPAMLDAL